MHYSLFLICQRLNLQRLTETTSLAVLNFGCLSSYQVLYNLLLLIFHAIFFQPAPSSYAYVTRNDQQRRLLAPHSTTTLLRRCFQQLQYCSNIATSSLRIVSCSIHHLQIVVACVAKRKNGAREGDTLGERVSSSHSPFFPAPITSKRLTATQAKIVGMT